MQCSIGRDVRARRKDCPVATPRKTGPICADFDRLALMLVITPTRTLVAREMDLKRLNALAQGRNMDINRRECLLGSAALAATGVVGYPVDADAEAWIMAVTAGISLAQSLYSMLSNSDNYIGPILQGIQIELEQVLRNQQVILAEIGVIEQRLAEIQRSLKTMPVEVVAFAAQTGARGHARRLQSLVKSEPFNRDDYNDLFNQLWRMATELPSVASTVSVPVTAKILFTSLLTFTNADKKFYVTQERRKYFDIADALKETLEQSLLDRNLPKMIFDQSGVVEERAKLIEKSPFGPAALLAEKFWDLNRPELAMYTPGDLIPDQHATLCLISAPAGPPGSRTLRMPKRTHTIRRIGYTVRTHIAHGGRPFYNVERSAEDTWQKDEYITQIYPDGVRVLSGSSAGCIQQMRDVATGSNEDYRIFLAYLEDYSLNVAYEGTLNSYQASAKRDLPALAKFSENL
jgi:hypothetical protein